MRAVLCKAFGPPDALVVEDVPSPTPGPGQVVIGVAAAGVNFPDVLIIENKYQFKPPLPFSPGGEVAGIVRAVGPEVAAVRPGDRVAACLPNIPEAVIAVLGTTSIGAIWSSCGPDFGTRGVLDRFSQLAPKVLLCVDGYQYGGRPFSRKAEMRDIIGQLPSLEHVIYLPYLDPTDRAPISRNTILFDEMLALLREYRSTR